MILKMMMMLNLLKQVVIRPGCAALRVTTEGDTVWQRIFLQSFSNHWEHLISYTQMLGDGGGGGGVTAAAAPTTAAGGMLLLILIVQHIHIAQLCVDLRRLLMLLAVAAAAALILIGSLSFYCVLDGGGGHFNCDHWPQLTVPSRGLNFAATTNILSGPQYTAAIHSLTWMRPQKLIFNSCHKSFFLDSSSCCCCCCCSLPILLDQYWT